MSRRYPFHVVARDFTHLNLAPFSTEHPEFSSEENRHLEAFIAERERTAREKGGIFFDGPLTAIDLSSMREQGSGIEAQAQLTSYARHVGLSKLNPANPVQAIYVNGLVLTTDNRLLFGTNDAVEFEKIGKLNLPAGAVDPTFNTPNILSQLYVELGQELFLIPDVHYNSKDVITGWMNGASSRDGDYHVTVSHVVPINLSSKEAVEYFNDTRALILRSLASAGKPARTEFSAITSIPNDRDLLEKYIERQDDRRASGDKQGLTAGKALDVVDEWVHNYGCNPEALKIFQTTGPQIDVAQPDYRLQ